MNYHKNLAKGKWQEQSFLKQMANIGSEVFRFLNWKEKNRKYSDLAFERALELIDFTISDLKNANRLKELCRMREMLVDYFFDNNYKSTKKSWENYFYAFTYAARVNA